MIYGNLNRFTKMALRAKTQSQAVRLWELADHSSQCDEMWAILTAICPWAFDNPDDVNSIRHVCPPAPTREAIGL